MLYEVTATDKTGKFQLITSTRFFNHAIDAKNWAIGQGFTEVTFHKFTDL